MVFERCSSERRFRAIIHTFHPTKLVFANVYIQWGSVARSGSLIGGACMVHILKNAFVSVHTVMLGVRVKRNA